MSVWNDVIMEVQIWGEADLRQELEESTSADNVIRLRQPGL